MPVEDLDGFLAAVADREDRAPVRLETLDLDGKPGVLTLKLDLEYWPTYELRRDGGVWRRVGRRADEAGARLAAGPAAR